MISRCPNCVQDELDQANRIPRPNLNTKTESCFKCVLHNSKHEKTISYGILTFIRGIEEPGSTETLNYNGITDEIDNSFTRKNTNSLKQRFHDFDFLEKVTELKEKFREPKREERRRRIRWADEFRGMKLAKACVVRHPISFPDQISASAVVPRSILKH